MDIAKYAGLFFVRSEYVYLPGLGNLEIKKGHSSYSSEMGAITPGKVEVIYTPTLGIIDDSFANFIANNERISIAAAANAIAEFTKRVKADVLQGNKVEIPGIGHFYNKDGRISFEVSEDFEYVPKPIPVFKNVSRTEEYQREKGIREIIEETPYRELSGDDEIELEPVKVNYAKLITLILIALIILGGIGYLIYSLTTNNGTDAEKSTNEQVVGQDIDVPQQPIVVDSARIQDSIANAGFVRVIVNEYKNEKPAQARLKKLTSINYDVELVTQDSMYYIVVKLPASDKGPDFVVDSIRRILNPNYNARIYKP